MTGFIKLQTPDQSIRIGFTDQKVSGRAGLLGFAGFLHWHQLGALLARVLPHQRTSKKAIPVADLALGFLAGILAGAQKLTQVAHLRGDVMLPELLAIVRGQPVEFHPILPGIHQRGKEPEHLPSAVAMGDGAVARSQGRLQSGSGFDTALARGRASGRSQKRRERLVKTELLWTPSDVAEVWHEEINWPKPRRVILIRHRIAEKQRPGGKRLIECPGYLFQALVTNLPESARPIDVWRDYNGRAGCEEVIKQLDADFALPKLCLKGFWGTEAALSLAVFSYNLCLLFQRHLGWLDRVTAATLRYRLFTTSGIISQSGGTTTIRLAVREPSQRGVVAAAVGEDSMSAAQLQFSGRPTSAHY